MSENTGTNSTKSGPGRPSKSDRDSKRSNLSARITSDLSNRLDAAAKASGRSLSQEVGYRLEQSFSSVDARNEGFGGEQAYKVMRWLALSLDLSADVTGKDWRTDRRTMRMAIEAMSTMLEGGVGEIKDPPDAAAEHEGRQIGERLGSALTELALRD